MLAASTSPRDRGHRARLRVIRAVNERPAAAAAIAFPKKSGGIFKGFRRRRSFRVSKKFLSSSSSWRTRRGTSLPTFGFSRVYPISACAPLKSLLELALDDDVPQVNLSQNQYVLIYSRDSRLQCNTLRRHDRLKLITGGTRIGKISVEENRMGFLRLLETLQSSKSTDYNLEDARHTWCPEWLRYV